VDPHHVDANPDADSTYHPDADPDSDFYFAVDLNADRVADFHLMVDADPDPTFHPDADPGAQIGSYSIHFGLSSANLFGSGSGSR
jgi:hypothetical protein